MTEELMEDGDWRYTFSESEDPEIHQFLTELAKEKNIELESPEFDEMFSEILITMLNDKEFLDRVKKENDKLPEN